ncbi:MAG: IMPACT family protein [Bacillota bacterium]
MEKILTVKRDLEIKNRVKDSKFLANTVSVVTVEEAQNFVEKIRKKYYDASHNVSAFKIGTGDQARKYHDDDGEPAGSSGPPVLQAIEGENLTNTVIVVTRYFGGTKLGIGGLIRAYGDTARMVIQKAGIRELQPVYKLMVEGDYDVLGTILGQIESVGGHIKDTEYNNKGAEVYFFLYPEKYDLLKEKLIEKTGAGVDIHKIELLYASE